MATQTGSIDLSTTGSFKTYASGEYATLDYVNPTETVSGTIVSASDALAAPPRDLTIYGTSTQDGTPTPEAPVPIVSVDELALWTAGRNLCVPIVETQTTLRGITFTPIGDGTFETSGVATANSQILTPRKWLPAGTYTLSGCPAGGSNTTYFLRLVLYSASSGGTILLTATDHGSSTSITIQDGGWALLFVSIMNGKAAPSGTWKPQLELGSTATEYEQYQGTSTSIDLQGHQLRSLPDGTRDELTVDSAGNVTLTQRVGVTTQATTDGISATVGTDAMSTTGDLSDGATVIYRLGSPQTVDLGTVELPTLPSPDVTAWCVDTTPISMEVWKASANPEYYRVSSEVTQTAVDVSTLFEETGELSTLIRDYSGGTLVAKVGQDRGALVNADGSFDVVALTWSGETPTVGAALATFGGSASRIGASTSAHVEQTGTVTKFYASDGTTQVAEIGLMPNTDSARLWLKDRWRYITSAQESSTSEGVTTYTDVLAIGNYGSGNGHEADVQVLANGTSGTASVSVSSTSSTGSTVNISPDGVRLDPDVNLYAIDSDTYLADLHVSGQLSASSLDLTNALPVAEGGTGSTSVYKTPTASDVISAASGRTLGTITYAEWGKVAQLSVTVSGFSASTGSQTVGTVVSGKRPAYAVYATAITSTNAPYASLGTDGALSVYWASAPGTSTSYTMRFVYLLA